MSVRRQLLFLSATVIATLMMLSAAAAQTQSAAGVVVTSEPPGAIVELRGEHTLTGVTPWRLDRRVSGTHELRAVKPGYEDWNDYVMLSATRRDSIFIRLSRKTPMGAGLRSAIFPGWGQHYVGQKGKGKLFMLAEIAAIGGVLWADAGRADAENDYEAALRAYDRATQVDDLEEAYEHVLSTFDEYDDWHQRRKRLAYVAAGIWVANLVDAIVLYPSPGVSLYAQAGSPEPTGLYASIDTEETRLGFAFGF